MGVVPEIVRFCNEWYFEVLLEAASIEHGLHSVIVTFPT